MHRNKNTPPKVKSNHFVLGGMEGQQLHFSTWGTMGVGVGYEQVTLRRLVVAAMAKWQIRLDSNPVRTSVVKLKAIEMNFQTTAYL